MSKDKISEIFRKNGSPVYFVDYTKVCLNKYISRDTVSKKDYKTVFLTYIPYAYTPSPSQNLCRYAALEDYHKYIPRKLEPIKKELTQLFPNNIFDIYTDNSPIDEKRAAEISGLGCRGNNSLIITEEYGSYIFLAEIISDMDIDCAEREPRLCENCGKCEKACPSGALKNGKCDITKCVSALTQKKGELTQEEQTLIKNNGLIWGCDRCQEVCPKNQNVKESEFAKDTTMLERLTLEDIANLSDKQFRAKYADRAFTWRGVATLRRNAELIENDNKDDKERNCKTNVCR